MQWVRWLGVGLCAVQGGYMAFDGLRALVMGSYVTPRSGRHAGQLGPWAQLVRAVGIRPESTGMKLAFVVLGAGFLTVAVGWAVGVDWARWLAVVMAAGTLWYLVVGTVISAAVLMLLVLG